MDNSVSSIRQELLRSIPSVNDLLSSPAAQEWLAAHPRPLVADCLRAAAEDARRQVLDDKAGRCGAAHVTAKSILEQAGRLLADRTSPHIRRAINATGIILHTGLGRAVWPESVVNSMAEDLKGYVTLAVDRRTGQRSDRDHRLTDILTELTGAEDATVVNNNAAATMLVLAALAKGKEVVVSRGQLIEIGGSFRLPEVMEQSGARLVEVGATNRTHPRDYERAIGESTAAVMRVHPSNFRVVGFTSEVSLERMVEIAHARGVLMIDDLGAGAMVDLSPFGLPHEPTPAESIRAGADVVLFSGDKLIGASQAGIIVGRKAIIEQVRKHPLMRAMRADKTCLMALERTLHLFRDPQRLCREHPTYRMICTPLEELRRRAYALAEAIGRRADHAVTEVAEGVGYLGSGSLPTQELPTFLVRLTLPNVKPEELSRRLRMDEACVFSRLEADAVMLDARTMADADIAAVAEAVGRASKEKD